jgi:hypothetical protein
MEFGETGFADHEQSSPHQRTHAAEKDTKLIDPQWTEGSAMRAFCASLQVLIVADRKSDNKKVSFDRAILFELFMIPMQL